MALTLKQILKREFLVLLAIVLSSFLVVMLTFWLPNLQINMHKYSNINARLAAINSVYPPYRSVRDVAIGLIFFGYPVYWVVKLFILGMKHLRK